MPACPRILPATTLLVLWLPPIATAAPERWRAPVPGVVLRPFHVGPDRFARGQHRGVDLAARVGTPVRSACSGRVWFAGRVPAGGRTVSVRCGRLLATYQHLGTLAVRRGEAVPVGVTLGTAGRSGDPRDRRPHVHLGARELATGRYVDPLALLRASRPTVPGVPPTARDGRPPLHGPGPPVPAPRPVAVRPRAAPVRAPTPVGSRARVRGPGPTPPAPVRAPGLPWTAWAGIACLAAGAPLGAVTRRRRRVPGSSAQRLPRPAS